MRRCSRASDGCNSACSEPCGTGSETCLLSGVLVHPASNAAMAMPRSQFHFANVAVMAANASINKFDLLGGFRGDDRPAALLDPSAHPDTAAFERFRFYPRRGKLSLIAPANRYGH